MNYIYKNRNLFIITLIFTLMFGAERRNDSNGVGYDFNSLDKPLFRIGDYDFPSNPMNDRAKGYSIQGKVKNGVLNFGAFIDWDYNPSGAWGQYAYLPSVAFMAGVPGYLSTSEFSWTSQPLEEADNLVAWVSTDAYDAWAESVSDLGVPDRFSGVVYNIENDRGEIALQRNNLADFGTSRFECTISGFQNEQECESNFILDENGNEVYGSWIYQTELASYASDAVYEWYMDTASGEIYLVMLEDELDPNLNNSLIGLIFPWAFRPKLEARFSEYDKYDYGSDQEEWTDDDYYSFYGATVSESWMSRWNPKTNTDWHASTGSALSTHSTQFTSGDLFGNTIFTDSDDTYPLLAHSNYPSTWPTQVNSETLEEEPFWPGWYADQYFGDDPDLWISNGIDPVLCGSDPSRQNPDCWKELPGRFTSDSDIFLKFDDRWAHRANIVENNEYQQTGYPMGISVSSMVHSYGVSYAEDIMFVTVKVRNESGDYDYAFKRDKLGQKEYLVDANGNFISGEGLVMPDGTKLNKGKGFNYEKMGLGFYMDADVLMGDLEGYDGALHTNDDDFMEYYDCANPDIVNSDEWAPYTDGCPVVDGDTLRISMAMIYDYDGSSGGVSGFGYDTPGVAGGGGLGIVATQLLDSPYATKPVDLNLDGFDDIFPGEKLKMTDWHWFDWYNRPGVVTREGNNNCCAGDPGKAQARNKEEIQYKLLVGDNSNLSENEEEWFFHLPDPNAPEDNTSNPLNPHFDSLEGLKETAFFLQGSEGLDCVLLMSCGTFDLEVGEEVNFSFCVIYGEDRSDLLRNAEFAQIMYNARYQGYTAPNKPQVAVTTDHNQVKIHWTNTPETSKDVITSYTDFEGYKVYKSIDGGVTWGDAVDKVYDSNNTFIGWQPYQQFDLSIAQDESFCVLGFEDKCYIEGEVNESIISKEDCDSEMGSWLNFNDSNFDGIWNDGENYNCVNGITREIEVSGIDPEAPWLNLGNNSGLNSIVPCACSNENYLNKTDCDQNGFDWACNFYEDQYGTKYDYTFIDNQVTDGFEYTYSITAYDTGVMSDRVIISQDEDGGWVADTISVPDPNGWGEINSFQMLENSKGTTEYDDNFVKAIPGFTPTTDWSQVQVVPNPFIRHSAYENNEYELKWMITGLPERCTIKIFTVTGELVDEFYHESSTEAFEYWDLRNQNNQEVAPGMYFYTIEDLTNNLTQPYVGKFVIIR